MRIPFASRYALAFTISVLLLQHSARANPLQVYSIPGIRAALDKLTEQFEHNTNDRVSLNYEIYDRQKAVLATTAFDVAIFAKSQIEDLASRGLTQGRPVDIGQTSIGIAVRKGAPHPDISTPEALKRTLLGAKSIVYTKNSSTGVYITGLLEHLGLSQVVSKKLILEPGGSLTTPAVAAGKADIAIVLVSDILATPGVDFLGPLPAALQNYVLQQAVVGIHAAPAEAADEFIRFLTRPESRKEFAATGLEPPS